MPLCFPVWHSNCTAARFTMLVPCSCELAVHSCRLLCVAKLGSEFFWCSSLLRNNVMAANFQRFAPSYDYDRRRITACCIWTLVQGCQVGSFGPEFKNLKLTCTWGSNYIGQNRQNLITRIKEHNLINVLN